MYRGISSKELVVAMGRAGLMGSLGTGGMHFHQIRSDIDYIQGKLSAGQNYSMNLVCNLSNPQEEIKTIELYLEKKVKRIDAAAFLQITPALVLYRLKGLKKELSGRIICNHKILAKVSRPEVAKAFMSPAPERIVSKLLSENKITEEQARMSKWVPMSYDICVEGDSGGHTDQGNITVLLPSIQSLRKDIVRKYSYDRKLRIGLAGGIGTPEAAVAAFAMGADFIITGSINQCTVEAGMSDEVKDLLENINVQDTDYAPAGDMFELGAKVQVLKKGTFFPMRSNKLFMLYNHYDSLEEIPGPIQLQLQKKYFKKSFDDIWIETVEYYKEIEQQKEIDRAIKNPKHKMALVFRWYFHHSAQMALSGNVKGQIDYQVHTGPALGAFNQWVKKTNLESWKNRHVDKIGEMLMKETAVLLKKRLKMLLRANQ
jgi:trans-AT polyketide synthase/acyltransferase/oxidoreductase domain-containing protein